MTQIIGDTVSWPGRPGAPAPPAHDLQHLKQVCAADLGGAAQWQSRPHLELQDLRPGEQRGGGGGDRDRAQPDQVPGDGAPALHHLQLQGRRPEPDRILAAEQRIIPDADSQRT